MQILVVVRLRPVTGGPILIARTSMKSGLDRTA
jgi:hypothetical protein